MDVEFCFHAGFKFIEVVDEVLLDWEYFDVFAKDFYPEFIFVDFGVQPLVFDFLVAFAGAYLVPQKGDGRDNQAEY